jgi:SMI1/KNR4 family protein SUKH-1
MKRRHWAGRDRERWEADVDNIEATSRQLEAIGHKLAHLRARDPRHMVFGAETHHYALSAPLTPQDIEAAEASCRISLPASYRAFLTRMGNGGAGPGYGLYSLQESLKSRSPAQLAQPFPFVFEQPGVESFSANEQRVDDGLVEPPDLDPLWRDSRNPREFCAWVKRMELSVLNSGSRFELNHDTGDTYLCNETRDGAIAIAQYGCGITALLILTGPERGSVWVQDPNGSFDCSLYPIGAGGWMGRGGWERMAATPEKRLDFLGWYEDWLDNEHVSLDESEWERFEENDASVTFDEGDTLA